MTKPKIVNDGKSVKIHYTESELNDRFSTLKKKMPGLAEEIPDVGEAKHPVRSAQAADEHVAVDQGELMSDVKLPKWCEEAAREYATDERLVIPFTPSFERAFLAACRMWVGRIEATKKKDELGVLTTLFGKERNHGRESVRKELLDES
jgi:hypothetical protein